VGDAKETATDGSFDMTVSHYVFSDGVILPDHFMANSLAKSIYVQTVKIIEIFFATYGLKK